MGVIKTNNIYDKLMEKREFYLAGFFEYPEASRFERYAHAHSVLLQNMRLPDYDGEELYPCGSFYSEWYSVWPNYSYTFGLSYERLENTGIDEEVVDAFKKENELMPLIDSVHTVGGNGYTHSIPNFKRIITEGLSSYRDRIRNLPEGEIKRGLLDLVFGIETFVKRSVDKLTRENAPSKLIDALKKVPFRPAENLYEAFVSWNVIYYMDVCDDPGRLDNDLYPFYKGEDFEYLFRQFFKNVDVNDGWTCAIGPDYNELTLQIIHAIKGMRRPSVELRVRKNMPQEIWLAACDSLSSGCGNPVFYNEELYQEQLHKTFPTIPKEDLMKFNGGGCTETMLAGLSNVGSLDAGINLPYILSGFIRNGKGDFGNFEIFYETLIETIKNETVHVLDLVNGFRKRREKYRPNPMRTLLVDDCIDNNTEYNAGGARYNWSIINFAGIINCAESLITIKKLVFDEKLYSLKEMIDLLDKGDKMLKLQIDNCPHFGVDDDEPDLLAARFTRDIWCMTELKKPYKCMAFIPASIQFVTYADAGKEVPATPDGRKYGDPIADSLGAILGRDKDGLTAMLNSVAKLPLQMAIGTPVLNVRMKKNLITEHLPAIVNGFFKNGGMQMQVSCISKEDMLAALENPDEYKNLIVRIGGYSEYFNRLSKDLQQTVIDRTEF